eukprot:c11841_g1_i3.p1 GENE.c11841_g1_i3~~c11841_g1_i3.p1  ORF type:complete len:287 (-),score=78.87 c11841_g1_i3:252-1112(-)
MVKQQQKDVETQQLSANVRDNAVGITDSSTCSDFFTTLCAWEQRETADSLRDSMMPRMKLLSKQMNEMGAVLHVHTNLCSLDFGLPRIVTQCTDCAAKVANHSFNMTNFEATVHRWGHNAQKSDIFRVIIALETQRTYIDTDILFLTLNKELYMSQFVAVAVWEDRRLEPTNSAFCLARPDLTNILSQQRSKLATSHEFTYTALGPDLMSSVLLGNGRPASLLPQNPPDNADPLRMFEQMQYPMLHLTGAIRIRNRGYGYDELVEEIMKQVDLVKQGTTREWHAKT